MLRLRLIFFISLFLFSSCVYAQKIDSAVENLQKIPSKYLTTIDKKATQYANHISRKTEKTLYSLSKWESKIHGILLKTSPATAERLFGNNQSTFASLLEQYKKGEALAIKAKAPYDKYRDDITTSMKYLSQQKEQLNSGINKKVKESRSKLSQLGGEEDKSEAISQFIRERKKQLVSQVITQAGTSKYLQKINKDAFFYTESLQDYKENFSTSEKSEKTVKQILGKIPGFEKFCESNSQLAGLFPASGSFPNLLSSSSVQIVNGIPNRAALQSFIQASIPSISSSPLEKLQVPEVKETADAWQDKIANQGGFAKKEIPEFKSNAQHTKSTLKRLEYGFDFQFGASDLSHPTIANISAKIGYKLTDKFSTGVGVNYVMGLGRGWDKLKISNEGIGLRTYLKIKIKKGIDIQGGSEWNHQKFLGFRELTVKTQWQQAAVIGFAKNYSLKKKLKGSIQILYDFLANQHLPVSSPIIFRYGYGFN